jgi:hypothetical protein
MREIETREHSVRISVSDYRRNLGIDFRMGSLRCDVIEAFPTPLALESSDPQSISTANITAVDRSSPDPSTASLARYLRAPFDEEARSPCRSDELWDDPWRLSPSLLNLNCIEPPDNIEPPYFYFDSPCQSMTAATDNRPKSIAGSDASISSVGSVRSDTSFKSVDHRGARRGRKRWIGPPIDRNRSKDREALETFNAMQVEAIDLKTSKSQKQTKRRSIFCTWPDCDRTFQNRSDWARHEEAKHYCPYHWVCCLDPGPESRTVLADCLFCDEKYVLLDHFIKHDQFASCVHKDPSLRTFLRKDHLVQHITTTHAKEAEASTLRRFIIGRVVDSWRIDNPSMPMEGLYCGFCGTTCSNWKTRQDHIFDHLRSDLNTGLAYKSEWRPGRDIP